MAQQDGRVSLWVGTATDLRHLEEYLSFRYTEDGDAIIPPFASDSGIEWFDDDFREAEVFSESSRSLRTLLKGFSSDDVISSGFIQLGGDLLDDACNTVVLLYNFEYDGAVTSLAAEGVRLRFIGVVSYL